MILVFKSSAIQNSRHFCKAAAGGGKIATCRMIWALEVTCSWNKQASNPANNNHTSVPQGTSLHIDFGVNHFLAGKGFLDFFLPFTHPLEPERRPKEHDQICIWIFYEKGVTQELIKKWRKDTLPGALLSESGGLVLTAD